MKPCDCAVVRCEKCSAPLQLACPKGCQDIEGVVGEAGDKAFVERGCAPTASPKLRRCACGAELEKGKRRCATCRQQKDYSRPGYVKPAIQRDRLCKCGSVIPRVPVVPGRRQPRLCPHCKGDDQLSSQMVA